MTDFKKTSIKFLSVSLAIVLFVVLLGCDKSEISTECEYPVDVAGVSFVGSPRNVAVLSDSLADIVVTMGLGNRLTARTDECSQEEISSVPSLGKQSEVKFDSLIYYSPDLILTDRPLEKGLMEKISDSGVPVIVLSPATDKNSLFSLYSSIGFIFKGKLTGGDMGQKSAEQILSVLHEVSDLTNDKKEVRLCYFSSGIETAGDNEVLSAKSDELTSLMIESAGARNVAKDLSNSGGDSGIDYLFCDSGKKSDVPHSYLSDANRVCEIKNMNRQGRSIVDSITFMASEMRPELKSSLDSIRNKYYESLGTKSARDSTPSGEESYVAPSYGESGENVLKLQKRLFELGYLKFEPDSSFGDGTLNAVKSFQKANDLPVTGEIDEKTAKLIFSDKANNCPPPSEEVKESLPSNNKTSENSYVSYESDNVQNSDSNLDDEETYYSSSEEDNSSGGEVAQENNDSSRAEDNAQKTEEAASGGETVPAAQPEVESE